MPTITEFTSVFRRILESEEGQTMAEYGVVLAVITVATVGVFTVLSGGVTDALNRVVGLLPK